MIGPDHVIWALWIRPTDNLGTQRELILTLAQHGPWRTASGDTPASTEALPLVNWRSWGVNRKGYELDGGAIKPGGLVHYKWRGLNLHNPAAYVDGPRRWDEYERWDFDGATWSWYWGEPTYNAVTRSYVPPAWSSFTQYASGKVAKQPVKSGDSVALTLLSQSDELETVPISPVVLKGLGGAIEVLADVDAASAGNHVSRPDHAEMNVAGDFTFMARVRGSSTAATRRHVIISGQVRFEMEDGDTSTDWTYHVLDSSPTGNPEITLQNVGQDTWATLTIVYHHHASAATVDAWLDDTKVVDGQALHGTGTVNTGGAALVVQSSNNETTCRVAFLRRWNRALTDDEILERWGRPIDPQAEEDLVCDPEFNEGASTICFDRAGNSNAVLTNHSASEAAAAWVATYEGEEELAEVRWPVAQGTVVGAPTLVLSRPLGIYAVAIVRQITATRTDIMAAFANGEVLPPSEALTRNMEFAATNNELKESASAAGYIWAVGMKLDVTGGGVNPTPLTVVARPFDIYTENAPVVSTFVEETLTNQASASVTLTPSSDTRVWELLQRRDILGAPIALDVEQIGFSWHRDIIDNVSGGAARWPAGEITGALKQRDTLQASPIEYLITVFGPRWAITPAVDATAQDKLQVHGVFLDGDLSTAAAIDSVAKGHLSAVSLGPCWLVEGAAAEATTERGWKNPEDYAATVSLTETEIKRSLTVGLRDQAPTAVCMEYAPNYAPLRDIAGQAAVDSDFGTRLTRPAKKLREGSGCPELPWKTTLNRPPDARDLAKELLEIQAGTVVASEFEPASPATDALYEVGTVSRLKDTRSPPITRNKNSTVIARTSKLNRRGHVVTTADVWMPSYDPAIRRDGIAFKLRSGKAVRLR